jgi:hypothetical protein
MKRLLIILFALSCVVIPGKAQENDPFEYGQEFLFGVTKSTTSGLVAGGFFRYSAKKTDRLYQSFGIEVAHIRHPQELRDRNPFFFNTSNYYAGKEKYLLSTRLLYGYDYLIFKKAEQKGVQINGVLMGGPSLGFISDYFLRTSEGRSLKYSEIARPGGAGANSIIGPAGYFAGLGNMEMTIGLNVRASLQFEFSSFKSNITGFEVGFIGEIFSKEIQIVPTGTKNYRFYPSAFLSILFGSRK